jgi:hypothetical protein
MTYKGIVVDTFKERSGRSYYRVILEYLRDIVMSYLFHTYETSPLLVSYVPRNKVLLWRPALLGYGDFVSYFGKLPS